MDLKLWLYFVETPSSVLVAVIFGLQVLWISNSKTLFYLHEVYFWHLFAFKSKCVFKFPHNLVFADNINYYYYLSSSYNEWHNVLLLRCFILFRLLLLLNYVPHVPLLLSFELFDVKYCYVKAVFIIFVFIFNAHFCVILCFVRFVAFIILLYWDR